MEINIKLDQDQVESVVVQDLLWHYNFLKKDIDHGYFIHNDPKDDEKLLKSLKRVLAYYGEEVDGSKT